MMHCRLQEAAGCRAEVQAGRCHSSEHQYGWYALSNDGHGHNVKARRSSQNNILLSTMSCRWSSLLLGSHHWEHVHWILDQPSQGTNSELQTRNAYIMTPNCCYKFSAPCNHSNCYSVYCYVGCDFQDGLPWQGRNDFSCWSNSL